MPIIPDDDSPISKILASLEYSQRGDGYMALCPAHDDNNPSLSIKETDDGKVLLKCFAGCPTDKVVEAIGLTMRDLFPRVGVDITHREPTNNAVVSTNKGKPARTWPTAEDAIRVLESSLGTASHQWPYFDAEGNIVAVVLRWDTSNGKTFRPVSKVGNAWRIGDPDGPWPLFNLPALVGSKGRVYVCEGEKAAAALCKLGLVATTSAHGANSPHKTDWTPLAGHEVVILPDHDTPGQKYKEAVIELLRVLTPRPTIKVLELPDLPDHGDAVEFIEANSNEGSDYIAAVIEAMADDAEPLADLDLNQAKASRFRLRIF